MPLGPHSRFDLRVKMVQYALDHGVKPAARAFATTPKTVRKWVSRYRQERLGGLNELPRIPLRCTHKTPIALQRRIAMMLGSASTAPAVSTSWRCVQVFIISRMAFWLACPESLVGILSSPIILFECQTGGIGQRAAPRVGGRLAHTGNPTGSIGMLNAEWIEALDQQLSLLRDEEAEVYYRADIEGALASDRLHAISSRRRELLTDEAEAEAQYLGRASDDPAVKRKAELLLLLIGSVRIEEEPELLSLRHELEQAELHCKDMLRSSEGMRQFQGRIAACAKARVSLANQVSRRLGFRDFVHARCRYQEVNVSCLEHTIRWTINRFRKPVLALLRDVDVGRLSPLDLDRHAESLCRHPDQAFCGERLPQLADQCLEALGIPQPRGLIELEWADTPNAGAVHALKIGQDVRIVMRRGGGGFSRCVLLFHELGHALYYAHVPDSALLLDTRIGREGLAEALSGLVVDSGWLLGQGDMAPLGAKIALAKHRALEAYRLLSFARETLFEVAMYREDASVEEAWRGATRACFGVDDTCGIYPFWVFTHPLDMKDYLFAQVIRESVLADLYRRFGQDLFQRTVGPYLVDRYYRTGNLKPWYERFPLNNVQHYQFS